MFLYPVGNVVDNHNMAILTERTFLENDLDPEDIAEGIQSVSPDHELCWLKNVPEDTTGM